MFHPAARAAGRVCSIPGLLAGVILPATSAGLPHFTRECGLFKLLH